MMNAVIILTVPCVSFLLACSFLLEIVSQFDKTNEELLEENQKLREKLKKAGRLLRRLASMKNLTPSGWKK